MTPPIDATEALKEYWLLAKCYREKITYQKISEVGEKRCTFETLFAWRTSSSLVGQKRHDIKKEDPEKHKPGRKSSPKIRFTREMSRIKERNGAPATFRACKLSLPDCADAIRVQYKHESVRVQRTNESASPETRKNALQSCSNPQTWMDANPQTHYFNVTKRSVFIFFSIDFPALFVNFKVELSSGTRGSNLTRSRTKYETEREPELDLIHRRIELGIRARAVDRIPPPKEMEFVHYPTYMRWNLSKLEGLSSSSRHGHSLHTVTQNVAKLLQLVHKAKQTSACFMTREPFFCWLSMHQHQTTNTKSQESNFCGYYYYTCPSLEAISLVLHWCNN
jgi:hypothetical protein